MWQSLPRISLLTISKRENLPLDNNLRGVLPVCQRSLSQRLHPAPGSYLAAPARLIKKFASSVEKLIIIEELDPFIEEAVRLMGISVDGKSIFPLVGEFDPRVIRESAIRAGLLPESAHIPLPGVEVGPLPGRPPVLCPVVHTVACSTCSTSSKFR